MKKALLFLFALALTSCSSNQDSHRAYVISQTQKEDLSENLSIEQPE